MGKHGIRVELLDGSMKELKASLRSTGDDVLRQLWEELGLFETDYFGIFYKRTDGTTCWLDGAKTLKSQNIRLDNRTSFQFSVKFYPSDPCEHLRDEYTRYLFCLAIKRDIRQANLTCAESMMAQIASCLVQTEFGDFHPDDCTDTQYISDLNLLPIPSSGLLNQIRVLHQQREGQTPLESDMVLLEKVRQLESYGTKPVNCRDGSSSFIKLSCCESGISVFQDTLLHTWRWTLIRKLSFKQKQFFLKLRREDGTPSETKTFIFGSRDAAKAFWKNAIETHTFFNLRVGPPRKPKPFLISRGSSFRYSGRTQVELKVASGKVGTRQLKFPRKTSVRSRKEPSQTIDISEIHAPHPTPSPRSPAKQVQKEIEISKPESTSDFSELDQIVQDMNGLKSEIRPPRTDIELKPDHVEEENVYDEPRKLRCDVNYSVCREILNTERTHLKDLQVVVLHFRNALRDESGIPEQIMSLLYSNLDPIFEFHKEFVGQLEQRAAEWESAENAEVRIGEFFKAKMKEFAAFAILLERLESVMQEVETALQTYPRFLQVWRSFEARKLCYLPISMFLLKPICRLFQYHNVIARMENYEGMSAQKELQPAVNKLKPVLNRCLQFQITSQLQRELVGADHLLKPGREFVREGYLRKWAGPKGGFNARMFFLFNDCILWTTSKIDPPTIGTTSSKPWKLSVELPLNNVTIELSDMDRSAPNSFALNLPDIKHQGVNYEGKVTSMILSASDGTQRERWIKDLELHSNRMRHSSDPYESVATGNPTATFHVNNIGNSDDQNIDENKMKQNTTTQVCWFRYCTLGFNDHLTMSQNVMAGYLMRKFKNKPTTGLQENNRSWQRLWVVLNTFSIHFYKRHQESAPLANLPLLEYKVYPVDHSTIPNCKHQYIFMIKLKKHEYHFAAETEYSYRRWMETLRIATLSTE